MAVEPWLQNREGILIQPLNYRRSYKDYDLFSPSPCIAFMTDQ